MELPLADPATAWSLAVPAWSCPRQIPLQRGARRLQRGAAPGRSRYSVELGGSSVEFPAKNPATAWSSAASAWSCPRQIPLQRGARRLQPGAAPGRSRYSVEFGGFSVELPPADPATAWSLAASAWSCPRQIPLQRGVRRLQRGAAANRSRYSVEFGGFSVELPPADPATAWSSAPPAWSCPRQIPLQRGVRRLQRGAAANRSRYSVEFGGFSVELPPTDPATAWGCAAPAWSSRQKTPPQRGVRHLQRGAAPGRSRYSVELGGSSVELPPADPATAWSLAVPAWSCPRQIPLQRGVRRLQRGAAPGRSRYSVEFGGFSVELAPADPATAWSLAASAWSSRQKPRHSVEFGTSSVELPPADPATAWSSAASAWSCPRQTPLQRGVRRLQRGAAPGRPRYGVELSGSSVELPPADPATAWSSAAPAWSCPRQTPLRRGAQRLQRGAAPGRSRHSVELGGSSGEFTPSERAKRRSRHV